MCLGQDCVHICAGVQRGQKRALEPLKLELQGVVNYLLWVLETEP